MFRITVCTINTHVSGVDMSPGPRLTLQETWASNNDLVMMTVAQSVRNALPHSGDVRCKDAGHDDVLQCNVIYILGHWPFESVHFLYHWVLHSNCAHSVCQIVHLDSRWRQNRQRAMIRHGTPGSEGLRLLLPLHLRETGNGASCGNYT